MTSTMDELPDPIAKLWKLSWWALLLRGLIAIGFGVIALAWPESSILALVLVYGAYVVADGVFAIVAAFSSHTGERWWLLASGFLGVAAGVLAMIWPGLTAIVLVLIIGFWSIMRGIVEIAAAIRLRKQIPNEWMLILAGIISVAVGIMLVVSPIIGAFALIWVIGVWAIAFGILMVGLAFRVRSHKPG